MNNDLILERLAALQHQTRLKEAEVHRRHAPAVTHAGWWRKLPLALRTALAFLAARGWPAALYRGDDESGPWRARVP